MIFHILKTIVISFKPNKIILGKVLIIFHILAKKIF